RIIVDALCVAGCLGVEKAQEEHRVNVVVSTDSEFVCVDLPKKKRLNESPRDDQGMEILHRCPEFEGTQHVAFDIYVAGQIGIPDPALVDTLDRAQTAAVFDRYTKAWRISTK